jgi:hypothetical protein
VLWHTQQYVVFLPRTFQNEVFRKTQIFIFCLLTCFILWHLSKWRQEPNIYIYIYIINNYKSRLKGHIWFLFIHLSVLLVTFFILDWPGVWYFSRFHLLMCLCILPCPSVSLRARQMTSRLTAAPAHALRREAFLPLYAAIGSAALTFRFAPN